MTLTSSINKQLNDRTRRPRAKKEFHQGERPHPAPQKTGSEGMALPHHAETEFVDHGRRAIRQRRISSTPAEGCDPSGCPPNVRFALQHCTRRAGNKRMSLSGAGEMTHNQIKGAHSAQRSTRPKHVARSKFSLRITFFPQLARR